MINLHDDVTILSSADVLGNLTADGIVHADLNLSSWSLSLAPTPLQSGFVGLSLTGTSVPGGNGADLTIDPVQNTLLLTNDVAVNSAGYAIRWGNSGTHPTVAGSTVYLTSGSPMSVAFWHRNPVATSTWPLSLKTNGTSPMSIGTDWGGAVNFTNGVSNSFSTTGTVTANTWYHVAIVYNGGTISSASSWAIYIDGVSKTVTGAVGSVGGTNQTSIARRADAAAAAVDVDDVRVFNTAITSGNVTSLYNAGAGSAAAIGGEVLWWKGDENAGTTSADSTGGGSTITLNSATFVAGKAPGSATNYAIDVLRVANSATTGERGVTTVGNTLGQLVLNGSAYTVANASTFRTAIGAAGSGANTDLTSVYLNNTGLKVKDTDASHGLSIVPGSNLTADRTLTLTTGDASRTVTLGGNLTTANVFITTGAFSLTLTATATTVATLPSGTVTLVGLTTSQAMTNKSVQFQNGTTALNYYEEGTWTPAITASVTPGTRTYASQTGRYTRIGRMVFVEFNLVLSNWTGSPSGNVSITGLPFTVGFSSGGGAASAWGQIQLSPTGGGAGTGTVLGILPVSGGTTANLWASGSGTAVALGQVTAANCGTGVSIYGAFSYSV